MLLPIDSMPRSKSCFDAQVHMIFCCCYNLIMLIIKVLEEFHFDNESKTYFD